MRTPLIAGNWKMNLNRAEADALARGVLAGAASRSAASTNAAAASTGASPQDHVEIALCPPAVYLDLVSGIVRGSRVALGAQNCYHEPNGAFTGEISTAMLLDLGCTYVILGHSERRHILGETDAQVNAKVRAALAAGLRPIVCVGELLAEREAGQTQAVVARQFQGALVDVSADQARQIVIAYEPVWAIGTGKVATPAQAEEVHADLRKLLGDRYNSATRDEVRILYGGSVKASNAAELLRQPNIDGALVGGASLKAEEFLGIVAGAPQN